MIEKFQRNETVEIYAEVKDLTGTLYDPTTIVVTIEDSKGTKRVDAQDMTALATGKFIYYYTISASACSGISKAKVTATDGGDIPKSTIKIAKFEVADED